MRTNRSRLQIIGRRHFLAGSVAGGFALSTAAPGFLGRLCAAAPEENDRILVIFQFSGGNDGLSTGVPHGIDDYYKARPKLAIPKHEVMAVNDEIGLVKTAAPFKELFDEGHATIIQGV